VGVYLLNDGSTYVVRQEGDHLAGSILGNAPAALSPSSDHEFFARDVDAVVDYAVDAKGEVASVRHRLGGWERNGSRADEARARLVMGFAEKTARRIRDQQPAPGSEAAIRKLFAGVASGNPDYGSMTPQFADLTRRNMAGLQPAIAGFGALKELRFKTVNEDGGDEFEADFEKAAIKAMLQLNEDDRISGAWFTPR